MPMMPMRFVLRRKNRVCRALPIPGGLAGEHEPARPRAGHPDQRRRLELSSATLRVDQLHYVRVQVRRFFRGGLVPGVPGGEQGGVVLPAPITLFSLRDALGRIGATEGK